MGELNRSMSEIAPITSVGTSLASTNVTGN